MIDAKTNKSAFDPRTKAKATSAPAAPVEAKAVPALIDLKSKPNSGSTTFDAVGKPAMIKIKGESMGPEATISFKDTGVSLEATLNLNLLTTHIDMRDEHMKNKYLEVSKYPTARPNSLQTILIMLT